LAVGRPFGRAEEATPSRKERVKAEDTGRAEGEGGGGQEEGASG
jgi:hypothetical protein